MYIYIYVMIYSIGLKAAAYVKGMRPEGLVMPKRTSPIGPPPAGPGRKACSTAEEEVGIEPVPYGG